MAFVRYDRWFGNAGSFQNWELASIHELEYAWGTFLARGMQEGVITEDDPRILTRALLGLRQSIWYWYEPGGRLTLDDVAAFFVRRQLALLGAPRALIDKAGGGRG